MRALVILIACTQHKAPPPAAAVASDQELLPDPRLEWLVIGEGVFQRPALLGELDEKWRREHDLVRIYGWRNGQAVVVLDDASERYDQVAVGMRLITAAGDDELRNVTTALLAQFGDDAGARLRKAGASSVKIPSTPAEGTAASTRLQELFIANGCEIQLRLFSPDPKPFPGRDVQALLSTLEPESAFAVKTHTPPGKLEKQALLDGKMNPTSLIFEMYVPHVTRALDGFERMKKAEAEAERRLGGRSEVVVETFGRQRKSDLAGAQKRVEEVTQALAAAGFPTGSPAAKRLFRLP